MASNVKILGEAETYNLSLIEDTELPQEIGNSTENSSIWADLDNRTAHLRQIDSPAVAAKVEINRFLQEPLCKSSENPLLWCEERQNLYPRLIQVMKTKLCMVATSVPCERVFSKSWADTYRKNNSFIANKVSQLLCLKFNLR